MLSTTVKNIINQSVNRWINQNTLGLELGKLDQNTNEYATEKAWIYNRMNCIVTKKKQSLTIKYL